MVGCIIDDFKDEATLTKAALEAKDSMSVTTTDVVDDGETDLQPEVMQIVAKARAVIILGLGGKPLRTCFSEKCNPHRM